MSFSDVNTDVPILFSCAYTLKTKLKMMSLLGVCVCEREGRAGRAGRWNPKKLG